MINLGVAHPLQNKKRTFSFKSAQKLSSLFQLSKG
jgi:hypothetical protein